MIYTRIFSQSPFTLYDSDTELKSHAGIHLLCDRNSRQTAGRLCHWLWFWTSHLFVSVTDNNAGLWSPNHEEAKH